MVNLENYEEYLLLEADGELNEAEQEALYAFLDEHPELKKELDIYKSVHLVPDNDIVFENKEQLMKREGGGMIINFRTRWAYAAAAAVFIFLFIGIYNYNQQSPNTTIADNNAPVMPDTEKLNNPPVPVVNPKEKELHSKPENPIVFKEKEKQTPVHTKTHEEPIKQQPIPIQEPKTENIAEVKLKEVIPQLPIYEAPQEPIEPKQELIAVKTTIEPIIDEVEPVKTSQTPSQWEHIKDERLLGLNDFSATVSNKVEQVRELKDKIKDSEITFKLGKKELFIVKL